MDATLGFGIASAPMYSVARSLPHLACGSLVVLCSLAASCGSSGPPPIDLQFPDYTLAPGEETYLCYAYTIPPSQGEVSITAFRPEYGPGTHHIFFGYTLNPEPEGLSECPFLSKTTWVPLFLGGQNTSDLELPPNTAFTLAPGTQIFMQLHLQNPTTETITATTAMHLDTTTPRADLAAAGIYGLDNRTVLLPPRTPSVQSTMSCAPGHDMNVFAVLGHMHTYGTHIELHRGDIGGETLYEAAWNFAEQPTTAIEFDVAATDMLTLRCEHQNSTSEAVPYGESSNTEMCAVVLYYSPADTTVDGCIQEPTP